MLSPLRDKDWDSTNADKITYSCVLLRSGDNIDCRRRFHAGNSLPSKFHTLISNAVQSYTDGEEMDIDSREGQEFADYMIQLIKGMASKTGN